jgi:hypothetical protein
MENKELEMILGILIILILPTMIGSLTNLIFKIKRTIWNKMLTRQDKLNLIYHTM